VTPALLVLVTPYTSVERLATEQFPLVPAALLKYPLRTDELIGEVKSPILIAHGDADELIPFDHARQLAAASGKRATLLRVDGARHGDIHQFPAYLAGLSQRMEEIASRPAQAARQVRLPEARLASDAASSVKVPAGSIRASPLTMT
jgi:fermentation-respiration switch protein FrsA (DUF1100 family)